MRTLKPQNNGQLWRWRWRLACYSGLFLRVRCCTDCRQLTPLGMISREIEDWQVTSSSVYPAEWDRGCAERYGRVYMPDGLGWCPQYKLHYTAIRWLIHWPLMGGLFNLVQRGGAWVGCDPAQSPPRCTKCNSPPSNGQCTNFIIRCGTMVSFSR